jgi:hypothetical protein
MREKFLFFLRWRSSRVPEKGRPELQIVGPNAKRMSFHFQINFWGKNRKHDNLEAGIAQSV